MRDSLKRTTRSSTQQSTTSCDTNTSALSASTGGYAAAPRASSSVATVSTESPIASIMAPLPVVDEQVQAEAQAGRALAALMKLEARPSPGHLAAQELGYWCLPNTRCFDLAGWPERCG